MMSESGGIKTSQRVSRSCIECGRKKIRCDKKIPCQPCIRRNMAHECRRPVTRVRGQLTVAGAIDLDDPGDLQVEELLRERGVFLAQIAELETVLALSKPCAHSHVSTSTVDTQPPVSLEALVPAFEQFDIGIEPDPLFLAANEKAIADRLYEPTTDPVFLLLPTKEASLHIVTYSLQTLGWLHCAVNADEFLSEHEEFWQQAQLGISLKRDRRSWLTVYLAILAVGILYSDLQDLPSITELPQLQLPSDDLVGTALHASRLWYEATLKEIERHGTSGLPSVHIVQALSILTLCHSNFGEHQREWILSGFAINMARCLDMHKLGNEAAFLGGANQRPEWSTTPQRELGRRLWWSCVIRDWLGSWSRPPSISPASFCCRFSTKRDADIGILPSLHLCKTPTSSRTNNSLTPSPTHYHSIMSRLAYIFYIYIKANTHRTPSKLAKAVEEINNVRSNLPLHLSSEFPANDDDKQWELENPWVAFQRYLITHVINFLLLGIARVWVSKESSNAVLDFRKLAVDSARNILESYSNPVPRVYRLVWTVSAATVAAAIYISLDVLRNAQDYPTDTRLKIISLLGHASIELSRLAKIAVHAAKGSVVIKGLLSLLNQPFTSSSNSPHILQDLLRQLSIPHQSSENIQIDSFLQADDVAWIDSIGESGGLGGFEDAFGGAFPINNWENFEIDME